MIRDSQEASELWSLLKLMSETLVKVVEKCDCIESKVDMLISHKEESGEVNVTAIQKELKELRVTCSEMSRSSVSCVSSDEMNTQPPAHPLPSRQGQGVVVLHPDQSDFDCCQVEQYLDCEVFEVRADVCDLAQAEHILQCLPENPEFVLLQPHLEEVGENASRASEAALLGHKLALARPLSKVYLGELPPRYDQPLMTEWTTSSNQLLGTMVECLDPSPHLVSQVRLMCTHGSKARAQRFEADGRRLTSYGQHLFYKNISERIGRVEGRGSSTCSIYLGGSYKSPLSPKVRRLSVSRLYSKKQLIDSFLHGQLAL